MPGEPQTIPAKLTIDVDALRGSSPDIAPLLERVAGLLADVRARMENDSRVLVDQREAGRLLSVSPKTLENHSVPCVRIGSRRMYRPEALRQWAAGRQNANDPAGVQ
jgi:hypothetical protein